MSHKYSKAQEGQDLDHITIAFIAIDGPSAAKIPHADGKKPRKI